MSEGGEATIEVASELRRLAACGDMPAYRRRQLLALAQLLVPQQRDHETVVDLFADPYYRRPGMRFRKPREPDLHAPKPLLLLTAKP